MPRVTHTPRIVADRRGTGLTVRDTSALDQPFVMCAWGGPVQLTRNASILEL